MSFFDELKRRNVFKVGVACMYEQNRPSLVDLHVAAQTRGSAPLLHSLIARVGTSLRQGPGMP